MNVGLAYPHERGTTGEHLGRALEREHRVTSIDLRRLPGWRVYFGCAIPMGWPPDPRPLLGPDGVAVLVEVDGQGGRHMARTGSLGIPRVFWGIDSHRPSKRRFHRAILDDFDHIFLAQKDDVPVYRQWHPNVQWLPLAAASDQHRDLGLTRDLDVVFVGSLDPSRHLDRVRLLERLSRRFRVHCQENVWGEDMARLFSRARIVFNKSVGGDLNMRVFEAMACGAMLLTDRIDAGLDDLFEDRRHLVTYRERDLEDLVAHYLAHDDERLAVATSGKDLVLRHHTYDDRARHLLRPFMPAPILRGEAVSPAI